MTEKKIRTPRQEEFTSEDGNKYMFQSVLPSAWVKIVDTITNSQGALVQSKAMPSMLEHVVVSPPGLELDDFEWAELNEVCNAAFQFQHKRK